MAGLAAQDTSSDWGPSLDDVDRCMGGNPPDSKDSESVRGDAGVPLLDPAIEHSNVKEPKANAAMHMARMHTHETVVVVSRSFEDENGALIPYQIQLQDGRLIYVSGNQQECIQPAEECLTAVCGASDDGINVLRLDPKDGQQKLTTAEKTTWITNEFLSKILLAPLAIRSTGRSTEATKWMPDASITVRAGEKGNGADDQG